MAPDFIAWDSELSFLLDLLGELRRTHGAEVLGLAGDPKQGQLWEDQLQPRLDACGRVLAILRDPNANAAFELGYCIGKGRPWAVAHPGPTRPAWLSAPPLQGALVQEGAEDIEVLERLLAATWRPPARASLPGAGTAILHCEAPLAKLGKRRCDSAFPHLKLLTPPNAPNDLPGALAGIGELAWVLPERAPDDTRHGDAVASAAIVAGYALATGRRVRIFRHQRATELADVAALAVSYGGPDELVDQIRAWLRETATDPLTAWRQHLRRAHARLVPFFEGAADKTLADVFVDLEVEGHEGRHGRTLDHEDALTVSQLVERYPRAALLGEPGAGKTTLVRHLAWSLGGDQSGPVPVFLPLARHLRGHLDPAAVAEEESGIRGLADELRRLDPARLWVLLDGLDEVPQERMESVREQIEDYADKNPGVHILVTGRRIAEDVGAIPASFKRRAMVRKLDAPRQEQLLVRLLGAERARPLVAELMKGARWAGFATNPLLLTLVAVVAREQGARGGALPSRRSLLYGRAVDLLLSRGFGVEKRGVKDTRLARDLLQRLSLELQEKGGESWGREELEEVVWRLRNRDRTLGPKVKDTWDSQERLMEDLGTNSGVLGPHDGGHAPWRFLHRSLREYLAAERLVVLGDKGVRAFCGRWEEALGRWREHERSLGEDVAPRPEQLVDPARWGEVLGLLCGLVEEPRALLERLREQSPELARRAVLGADMDGEEAMRFLLETEDWDEEELAQLAREHGPEAVWALVRPGWDLRTQAALWYALDVVGAAEGRRFFAAMGRELGTPPDTVLIRAGTFRMGSPEGVGYDREHPAHMVTLTRDYRLGVTPVTEAEWAVFMGEGPTSQLPAVEMTWYEARLYAAWVGGDLPTEAEWEFACRAGSDGLWCFGDDEAKLAGYAWFGESARGERQHVRGLRPNERGLYDIHGNVWEWCRDDARAYTEEPVVDPIGPLGGGRVARGGSFWNVADWCRSAYRYQWLPWYRNGNFGLRVRLPAP